jgi:proline iminopeptidase
MPAATTPLKVRPAGLHVQAIGSGPPIVVVHGGPDFDHTYFRPDLDRLADLGRLVYYDQRGRGRSYSGETADDVSLETEMADLDAVREWTGSGTVALLGHSWGTVLAMEYAVRRPHRVSHLVLLNSAPASHPDQLVFREHLARLRSPEQLERMAALRADLAFLAGDLATEAEYYRIHFSSALSRPEHLDEVISRLRNRPATPESVVAARAIEDRLYQELWLVETYDLLARLRQLSIPTLVLHGDHDFMPVELARHIADAIPDARLVVLPDCGHFSFLEQPEAVHAAVADLLAEPRSVERVGFDA